MALTRWKALSKRENLKLKYVTIGKQKTEKSLTQRRQKKTPPPTKKKFSRKTDNNKNDDPKSLTDKQYKCEIQHHAKIISMYCLNHIRKTHPSTSL